jgi:MSHA biogenesis protein MshJ
MLLIEPPLRRKAVVSDRMSQQQSELRTLQAQVEQLEQKRFDPDAANRTRRDALRRQIEGIDSELATLQKDLVPAHEMKGLLQDMLTRNPRLQLIALRTLPATPLIERPAPAKGVSAGAARPAAPLAPASNVFKHGVQLTLRGAYPDLHDYIARLEAQRWHMFWSRASLSAAAYPNVTITLTIFTLSLDKAWLVV